MFLASRAKGKMEGIMYRFIQQGRIAVLHCLVSLGGPSLGSGDTLHAVVICWTQLETFFGEEHRSK